MSAPIYEMLSLQGAARYYDAVMALAVCLTTALKLEMCLVRHEDVVTEFMREMKRVCSYLDLGGSRRWGISRCAPKRVRC